MEHPIEQKLRQLGIRLPAAPSPAANYLPYVVTGNLLFIAGQAAVVDGKLAYTCWRR
jgi:enamine deaminase RidA (YjgF/YER057c/UK114 family)